MSNKTNNHNNVDKSNNEQEYPDNISNNIIQIRETISFSYFSVDNLFDKLYNKNISNKNGIFSSSNNIIDLETTLNKNYYDFLYNNKSYLKLKKEYRVLLDLYNKEINYLLNNMSNNNCVKSLIIIFSNNKTMKVSSIISTLECFKTNNINPNKNNNNDETITSFFPLVNLNCKACLFLIFLINNTHNIMSSFDIEELVNIFPILVEMELKPLYNKAFNLIVYNNEKSNNLVNCGNFIDTRINKALLKYYIHSYNISFKLKILELISGNNGRNDDILNYSSFIKYLESLYIYRVLFLKESDYVEFISSAINRYDKYNMNAIKIDIDFKKKVLIEFLLLKWRNEDTKDHDNENYEKNSIEDRNLDDEEINRISEGIYNDSNENISENNNKNSYNEESTLNARNEKSIWGDSFKINFDCINNKIFENINVKYKYNSKSNSDSEDDDI